MYERAFNRGSNLRRLEIQLWEKRKSCIQEGGREGGRAERGGEKRNPKDSSAFAFAFAHRPDEIESKLRSAEGEGTIHIRLKRSSAGRNGVIFI